MAKPPCIEDGCESPSKTRRMCNRHYLRWWAATPKEQRAPAIGKVRQPLQQRILRQAVRQPDGCLHWTGRVNDLGYGQIKFEGRTRPAHVIAYEAFVGPVPEGMELDHVCHTNDLSCAGGDKCLHRRCIDWVGHLEPVTRMTNFLRSRSKVSANAAKTECVNGHPFDEANTVHAHGRRYCRTCQKAIWKASNERRKTANAVAKRPRTRCKNNHPWIDANIYTAPSGLRTCRLCTADAQARYKARRAAGSTTA